MKFLDKMLDEITKVENENKGYELRIHHQNGSFYSKPLKEIKEAFEFIRENVYDQTLDIRVYNLNTNLFIKLNGSSSRKPIMHV